LLYSAQSFSEFRRLHKFIWSRDSAVDIATRFGLDGPEIESRWEGGGARFSAPVQIVPEAHPTFSTMDTGSLPGVKWPGRGVDHPPLSSAEVKERAGPYFRSLCIFTAGYRANLNSAFCHSHLRCHQLGRVPREKGMCSEYLEVRIEGKYVGFGRRRTLGNKKKQFLKISSIETVWSCWKNAKPRNFITDCNRHSGRNEEKRRTT